MWTVRCHLHYLAGRPEERLTFDMQAEIGRRMGYADRPGSRGVERFMRHYFLIAKDVGDLTRIFCAILQIDHEKRGACHGGAGARRGAISRGSCSMAGGWRSPPTISSPATRSRCCGSSASPSFIEIDIHPRACSRSPSRCG